VGLGNILGGIGGFLIGGPVGAIAGAGIGGSFDAEAGQRATNAQNMELAQKQMDFQREMSNTAYQRATADMKAAGINPMVAYQQGGASSPAGAQATMQNPESPEIMQRGIASAMDAYRAKATIQNQEANTVATNRMAELTAAKTATEGYNAQTAKAETLKTTAEAARAVSEAKPYMDNPAFAGYLKFILERSKDAIQTGAAAKALGRGSAPVKAGQAEWKKARDWTGKGITKGHYEDGKFIEEDAWR